MKKFKFKKICTNIMILPFCYQPTRATCSALRAGSQHSCEPV